MSQVFRSRVYGKMNKRRREALGMRKPGVPGWSREECWRLMAERERRRQWATWWQRLWAWIKGLWQTARARIAARWDALWMWWTRIRRR